MAEASRSSTPSRTRSATAGSTGSQSTPSRISRLFSFGSAANKGGEDSSKDAANGHAGPSTSTLAHYAASTSGEGDGQLEEGPDSDVRPTTPTPAARHGSQQVNSTNHLASAADSVTLQRRNSRASFLSSMLASGPGPSNSPDVKSTNKGDTTLNNPARPGPSGPNHWDDASASPSAWRMPWSSPKKQKVPEEGRAEPQHPQQEARSVRSVGLTMDGESEETDANSLTPVESDDSGSAVVDEGISMSDTSGKVDFLTSLPLELSLYVLLFADVQTMCRCMQVSPTWNTIASDALIWRDYFYRNPGWELRPDILESGQASAYMTDKALSRSTNTPSKGQSATMSRARRSTTGHSENSIAARIGRRISDIVSDISFMALHRDRALAQDESATESSSQSNTDGETPVAGPSTIADLSHPISTRSATPSRTRSSTATSTAATHPSSFYTPLRSSMRQHSNTVGGPAPSRRDSQSFSIVQSLLESHGSPNLQGIPLGQQVYRDLDTAHPHFTLPHARNSHGAATPPRPESAMKHRRVSTGTFSPYASLMSPTKEFEPNASLFLDWKGLYRDRLELQRRWTDGRFTDRVLKGHKDSVYCVALCDDILISGSRDQTVKVWDATTGTLKRTVEAHTSSVLAIQYDGKIMVTGASNGELFVWDVDTWDVTDILEGHTMGVLDVQMNDRWIASCSKDTSVRVWRRDTKEAYRVLQGHRGPVNAIQLFENKICSASGDSLAKLWNIETGQVVRVFKGHERGLACVQYDGFVLATGSNDKTIRLWDPNTGECTRILKGHKDLVRTLAYDPIRKRLFSGSYDKSTRLWDLESGNLKMTFKTSHKSLVFDVTMDVSRLVSCSHDQRIVIIDFGEDLNARRFI